MLVSIRRGCGEDGYRSWVNPYKHKNGTRVSLPSWGPQPWRKDWHITTYMITPWTWVWLDGPFDGDYMKFSYIPVGMV
ncbi:hypothetical protein LCGC14_2401190 [marine sediment metagenome]|uniref:Uncharacterized protein n=1 Tax=marine sediment metagenome TaxID=412755 RepID=A0A0F9BVD9_9ZZZZ